MLSEAISVMPMGAVGKMLPSEKSLVLLVGDGYIAGAFLTSLFMPGVEALGPTTVPSLVEATKAKEEVICDYVAIILALLLALFWAAGRILDPSNFPIVPLDHDLFGAIPSLGIGAMVASVYAFIWGRFHREEPGVLRWTAERRVGEAKALLLSAMFAVAYFVVWLNPGGAH